MDSVTRPEASEDVIGGDVRAGFGGGGKGASGGANKDET